MGAGQPKSLPMGIVEALVAATDATGLTQLDRALSGAYADALCQLAHLDDKGRVRVLFEIMDTAVTAQHS